MRVGHFETLRSGLRELRRSVDVEIHERVDLRAWTVLGVGGMAGVVVRCHNENAVRTTLDLTAAFGMAFVALGGGTRLITPDDGLAAPVLSLTGELAGWETELDGIVAGGGANLAQVCRAATRSGLLGLEGCGDRNHSIGGLIHAAACGVVDLGDAVDWIELQRPGAAVERWRAGEGGALPPAEDLTRRIVLKVRFRLRPAAPAEVRSRQSIPRRDVRRRTTGPVFLDSPDASAADLLLEAGCADATVGGVRLGGVRPNELIAARSATAADVLELCRTVRDRVAKVTGVALAVALVFVDREGRRLDA